MDTIDFYYCFGLLKVAVIAQQIYLRYVQGHTRDPRFSHLDSVVSMIAEVGLKATKESIL